MSSHPRKRLIADRFRRVWAIVSDVAEAPGWSRRELADKFFLSERQVQADLNIIRDQMGLPLVRRQGYRFADEGPASGAGGPDISDVLLLALLIRQAGRDRSLPLDQLDRLASRLAALFPPHLRGLAGRVLDAATAPARDRHQQVFGTVADALLRGGYVQLASASGAEDAVIRPELVVPYLGGWYVVGTTPDERRHRVLPLDGVVAASAWSAPPARGGER